jgi:glyoxylate utilization-related uncharacterized protein
VAALSVWAQLVAGLQLSFVQPLPSLQSGGPPPAHAPPPHASPIVHALPSLQETVLLVCTHPEAGLQVSSVQTLLLLQFGGGPPTQVAPLQPSAVVHASPSSHGAALSTWTQPVAELQLSSVQPLPSLQLGGAPPTQAPAPHVSLVVQALPSLHGAVLLVWVQPVAGLQASFVHTLPSLQLSTAPPVQEPPLQTSLSVQALPSLQEAALLVCTQPLTGLQLSSVQPLPSAQLGGGPPAHAPPLHVSLVVHASLSLHAAVLLVWTQPLAGLQPSSVQPLPSLQLGGAPPTQAPAPHVSLVVQALPSLHGAVLLVWVQPVAGLQASFVHTLPSLQLSTAPPVQEPPLQTSLSVQALPSLQEAALLVCTQPLTGLQLSSVQPLPSAQLGGGPPSHAPPLHVSLVVHALVSLHAAVLLVWTQPLAGLQPSSVQPLPSLQLGGAPPTQAPAPHASLVVQALPSLHSAVLLVWVQPVAGLQASFVHTLPSLQFGGGPPTHVPPLQVSPSVQALPSLQEAALLVCTQPLTGLQPSSVQPLPSAQSRASLTQTCCAVQRSLTVH